MLRAIACHPCCREPASILQACWHYILEVSDPLGTLAAPHRHSFTCMRQLQAAAGAMAGAVPSAQRFNSLPPAVWRQRAGTRAPAVAAAPCGGSAQAAAGRQDPSADPHERYRWRPPCERGSAQGRWVLVWVLAGVVLSLRGMWGLCWVAWRPSALVCCSWGASAAAWSLCVMAAGVAAC